MKHPSIAIVTTVRDPGSSFRTWITYHRQIADKLYIFLDEPGPRDAALIPDAPGVNYLAGTQQSTMSGGNGVMERQIANVERAHPLCVADNIDWLVHIDGDELLWSPDGNVADFFAALSPEVATVSFVNHEVINTERTADNFKDLRFFKRNGGEDKFRQYLSYRKYSFFLFYGNGKSAVRISNYKRPNGVHIFEVDDGITLFEKKVCVLHYACPTYQQWLTKYRQLDEFQPYWWDDVQNPIPFQFHLDSRDVYLESKKTGNWQTTRDFYRSNIFSDAEVERMVELGIVFEADPTSIIELASQQ